MQRASRQFQLHELTGIVMAVQVFQREVQTALLQFQPCCDLEGTNRGFDARTVGQIHALKAAQQGSEHFGSKDLFGRHLDQRLQEGDRGRTEARFKSGCGQRLPGGQQALMQLLAGGCRVLQPAKDGRLGELCPGQLPVSLDELGFFASSSAVVVKSFWIAAGSCVMVFMGRRAFLFAVRSLKNTLFP